VCRGIQSCCCCSLTSCLGLVCSLPLRCCTARLELLCSCCLQLRLQCTCTSCMYTLLSMLLIRVGCDTHTESNIAVRCCHYCASIARSLVITDAVLENIDSSSKRHKLVPTAYTSHCHVHYYTGHYSIVLCQRQLLTSIAVKLVLVVLEVSMH
jgi:hypothetical protein